MSDLPFYKRMRILTIGFLVEPVIIMLIVGAISGELLLFAIIGPILGLATSIVNVLVWLLARRELESNGFRW